MSRAKLTRRPAPRNRRAALAAPANFPTITDSYRTGRKKKSLRIEVGFDGSFQILGAF
jgi:hypothetical protein